MIKRADQAEIDSLRLLNKQLEKRLDSHGTRLEAASEGLDTLAYSISHDLRSPLNIINGFADLLTKHSAASLDEKGLRFLQRITTATAQIGRMIEEILSLAKMSQSELHIVPVDLGSLVQKAVSALEADKGDRRVVWLIGSLPTVQGDHALLSDVVTSLLTNALGFTRSREVARIQIGMLGGDNELTVFVRDNGASFDIKHRERYFNSSPDHRASSEPNFGAIRFAHVQRIIQRHGGRIWMEALPDGGASFSFALPTACAEPGPNQDPS